jgi:hypothetical protein
MGYQIMGVPLRMTVWSLVIPFFFVVLWASCSSEQSALMVQEPMGHFIARTFDCYIVLHNSDLHFSEEQARLAHCPVS